MYRSKQPPTRRLPQPDGPVKASAGQQPPVRAECHAPDSTDVTVQGGQQLPTRRTLPRGACGAWVPQPHRPASVLAQCHAADPAGVPVQRSEQPPTARVPQADGSVEAGTRQQRSVCTQRHAPDPTGEPVQRGQQPPTARVPQANRCILAAAGQQRPARTQCHAINWARVAVQRGKQLPSTRRPCTFGTGRRGRRVSTVSASLRDLFT